MNDLPKGWAETTLGELGRYLNGRGFKKSEWAASGRPIIRIQNLTGTSDQFNFYDGEADERHIVRKGDLLVSWAATLGVFKWTGEEAVLNQHIFKVESHIDPDFHRYLVQHALDALYAQTHGSGMVHITRGKFDSTPVLLPPLCEQRRIVASLDKHLSHLDAATEWLLHAQRRIGVLKQRLLDQVPAGPLVPLGELLAEPLRNGLSAKTASNGSVRVLTLTAVTRRSFAEANTKLIEPPMSRSLDDLWLRPGDVLVQRSNTPDLVGSAALYKGPERWAIFPDLLIRVRPGDSLRPEYLDLCLQTTPVRRFLRGAAQGIAGSMPKISQGVIERIEVPLPEVEVQDTLVAEYERDAEEIARQDAAIATAIKRSESLRRSVFAAALSGELMAQDPKDEPACDLLERIRAAVPVENPSRGLTPA